MLKGLLAVLVMVCVFVPSLNFAGELSRRSIRRSTEWESTDCYRPQQPSFYVYDIDSYNWAVREYNDYVSEMKDYISCVIDEANGDLDTLQKIIQNSISEQINEVEQEIEAAINDLEYSRMLID